ncbi:HK97 gp10 family phage protein [Corynebacterium timonense]|uniref:Phage protein, HK97 gp10 family n=1 Tax=Corynebacterium timonense TaxID=441500 RepID=A0A1H1LQ57_9CORY|nr:HK97 gp10 family phage protein [Corynebacterium timonense]SDR76470.1 phage protein, HK97 gp10 family [Corynebacterium timonense]
MAELDWKGDAIARSIERAAANAAIAGAEILGDEAVQRTPVDTGTLRASMKVTSDNRGTAAVSYNTPYAARQHEEIGWQHPGGGEAKFLENAVNATAAQVRSVLVDEIRKAMK